MILRKPIFWIVVIILAAIAWFMANDKRQAAQLAKAQTATPIQQAVASENAAAAPAAINAPATTPIQQAAASENAAPPSANNPAAATPVKEQQALSPNDSSASKAPTAVENGTQPLLKQATVTPPPAATEEGPVLAKK